MAIPAGSVENAQERTVDFRRSPIHDVRGAALLYWRFLVREALVDERAPDSLGIFFDDAAASHDIVPGAAHLLRHVRDDRLSLAVIKQETRALREDVFGIRK